jgi:hypothetical protein
MQAKSISISNIWDDTDEMIEFSIKMSNGNSAFQLEFYQHEDGFIEFAKALIQFPQNLNYIAKFELGNKTILSDYLSLEVACFEPNGNSAMKIEVKNLASVPHRFEALFYIQSEPASFNDFGNALLNWDPRVDTKFEWQFT